MECMKKLLDPVTTDDISNDVWNVSGSGMQYNNWIFPYQGENLLKFQADLINLVEGRVESSSFDPEYRKQLETYYQFSATRYPTKAPFVAKRIRDTLTVV